MAKASAADSPATQFDSTLRELRAASDRDKIADVTIAGLRLVRGCHAATILVARGNIMFSWRGFASAPLHSIAVPLEQGSVSKAIRGDMQRVSGSRADDVDKKLLAVLGRASDDLIVCPIKVCGQTPCVVALAASPDLDLSTLEQLTSALGRAFGRLVRNASR